MRYLAVACDYDGTIAKDGTVDPETIASLQRTKASGRRLIRATGRELEDLALVFSAVGLFDRVVGENGQSFMTQVQGRQSGSPSLHHRASFKCYATAALLRFRSDM